MDGARCTGFGISVGPAGGSLAGELGGVQRSSGAGKVEQKLLELIVAILVAQDVDGHLEPIATVEEDLATRRPKVLVAVVENVGC